jgi:prepilin-type N-terminal cleavage/methylation domain-containing protein
MKARSHLRKSVSGFTLIELLVVIIILTVLAGIAAPGWLTFMNRQRVRLTNQEIHQAMLDAQRQAKQRKETRQASFRINNDGNVQWSVHAAETTNTVPAGVTWNTINENITIDTGTTTLQTGADPNTWLVKFNYKGQPNDSTWVGNKITIAPSASNASVKGCVFVQTLLGSLRTARNEDCN